MTINDTHFHFSMKNFFYLPDLLKKKKERIASSSQTFETWKKEKRSKSFFKSILKIDSTVFEK